MSEYTMQKLVHMLDGPRGNLLVELCIKPVQVLDTNRLHAFVTECRPNVRP
jgi:hypothetical protein